MTKPCQYRDGLIFVGETTISGCPSPELAKAFVEEGNKRWADFPPLLTENNKVSLIGSLEVDALIAEMSEKQ
jgi:hypothetical protein